MSTSRHVDEKHFKSAEKFVDFLRPSLKNWGPPIDHSCTWVFRGQANADWQLIPTAWRDDAESKARIEPMKASLLPGIEERVKKYPPSKAFSLACSRDRAIQHMAQIEAETELVWQFAILADELGHPVPELNSIRHCCSRNTLSDYEKTKFPVGPKPNIAFGLAQHHGIPTRLLDWTRKPLIAAFFAAEEIYHLRKKGKAPTHLAVWAFDSKIRQNPTWQFFTCPRHQFPFLHQQTAEYRSRHRRDYLVPNAGMPQHGGQGDDSHALGEEFGPEAAYGPFDHCLPQLFQRLNAGQSAALFDRFTQIPTQAHRVSDFALSG
jgi:hypothetical protein